MACLQRLKMIDGLGKAVAERSGIGCVSHDIDIVETVKRHIEFFDKGHRGFALGLCMNGVIEPGMPWPAERACTKHVATGPAECVPETHRKAQMILHPLA